MSKTKKSDSQIAVESFNDRQRAKGLELARVAIWVHKGDVDRTKEAMREAAEPYKVSIYDK